jgi:hypothetical protein
MLGRVSRCSRRALFYFEQWGIDALIDLINKDTATLMWALPRRLRPCVSKAIGCTFRFAVRNDCRQSRSQCWNACDGRRTAAEVIASVRRDGGEWRSEAEVFTILKGLKAQG